MNSSGTGDSPLLVSGGVTCSGTGDSPLLVSGGVNSRGTGDSPSPFLVVWVGGGRKC